MIRRLLRSDLVLHGAIVFAGLIVANVMNYLYFMLGGRILGVEGYGEMTSLTSAVLTLAAPANVAQIIIARLAAELHSTGHHDALDRLTASVVRATTVIAAAVACAGVALAAPLEAFFHIASPWPIAVASLSLGLYAVITVQRGVLQGASRFGEFSASYGIEAAIRLVAGMLLAQRYGALGALLGLLAGVAGCFLYDAWVLRARRAERAAHSQLSLRRVVDIAWRIGLAQLMLTVLSFYDVVLVRNLFDARDAGLYAAAALVGRVMLGLLAFVPTLVMPKATARARSGASALPLFAAALALAGAMAAAGALAALVAPRTIVVTFAGRAFADAAPIVLAYVAAAGALGLANVVAAYQFGLHRYAFVMPATAAGAAEIAVVALWHPSIAAVVVTLLCGHAVFLGATFIGLAGTQPHRHAAEHLVPATGAPHG